MAPDQDSQFFIAHPDRQSHIRQPRKTIEIGRHTHQTHVLSECEMEFRSLGDHNKDRRRILLWRVPKDNVFYDPRKPQILKIPMLAFADESIEDSDAVLLPIIHEIMLSKAN